MQLSETVSKISAATVKMHCYTDSSKMGNLVIVFAGGQGRELS